MSAPRERPLAARAAAVADVDRADLVTVVLEFAEMLGIEGVPGAPCGRGSHVVWVLVDAALQGYFAPGPRVWVLDMHDGQTPRPSRRGLSSEARSTLAEVLRAAGAVR